MKEPLESFCVLIGCGRVWSPSHRGLSAAFTLNLWMQLLRLLESFSVVRSMKSFFFKSVSRITCRLCPALKVKGQTGSPVRRSSSGRCLRNTVPSASRSTSESPSYLWGYSTSLCPGEIHVFISPNYSQVYLHQIFCCKDSSVVIQLSPGYF